jgi:hypothetical protein
MELVQPVQPVQLVSQDRCIVSHLVTYICFSGLMKLFLPLIRVSL